MKINTQSLMINQSKTALRQDHSHIRLGLRNIKFEKAKGKNGLSKEALEEYALQFNKNYTEALIYGDRKEESLKIAKKVDDFKQSIEFFVRNGIDGSKKATDYDWDSYDDFTDEGLKNFLSTISACVNGTWGQPQVGSNQEWEMDPDSIEAFLDDVKNGRNHVDLETLPKYSLEEMNANKERFMNQAASFNEKTLIELANHYFEYSLESIPEKTIYGEDVKELYNQATGKEMMDIKPSKLGVGEDGIDHYGQVIDFDAWDLTSAKTFSEYQTKLNETKNLLTELSNNFLKMEKHYRNEANKYRELLEGYIDVKL